MSGDLSTQQKLLIARGANLDAAETRLDILIALTSDRNAEIRRLAEETLQRIPDERCALLLQSPTVDGSVLRYFLGRAPQHLSLLPLLLGHPDTPPDAIIRLATTAGPEVVPVLLDQVDLLKTPALTALKDNQTYLHWQKEPPPQKHVLEVDLLDLLIHEMKQEVPPTEEEVARVVAELGGLEEADPDKGGLVSKLARMKVAQRVKLALLGTREERAVLIRDSSRVVCRAVLSSPKLTDSEVESFAAMRNVGQEVLRLISMSRKFMKSYTVLRCLVNNTRTPIDVSLPLLNRLLPNDLRAASASREIPDTLRKMAKKLVEARAR